MDTQILVLGASRIVEALRRGKLSSVEATGAFLKRLESIQKTIHPMAAIWQEKALRMATASDERRARKAPLSPFDGLPLTLKENLDVQGHDSSLGVESRMRKPAKRDAGVVQMLREAGCVFLGKSNVSQLLLFHESSNPFFGRTANPYHPDRTAGGSSGGEAAAIAAYGSPGGLGTDIGGSIRVPAHFCGVAGLKPTVDRLSCLGAGTALPGQEFIRGQVGPLARTVDDLVTILGILDPAKAAALDPRVPPLPFGDPARAEVSGLRIGYFWEDGILDASPAVSRAVQRAVHVLQEAGATLIPFRPPLARELIFTYLAGLSSDGGHTVEEQLRKGPADRNLDLLRAMARLPSPVKRIAAAGLDYLKDPVLPEMLRSLGGRSVADYWKLTAHARGLQAEIHRAWTDAGIQAVVCPPHATPALPHGASRDFTLGGAFSMRYNFVNYPAGVVPVTRVRPGETERAKPEGRLGKRAAQVDRGSQGLPVGVQVVARPWQEDIVLGLMKVIETRVQEDEDFPRLPIH
jgi:fatty acid amide hydrolase